MQNPLASFVRLAVFGIQLRHNRLHNGMLLLLYYYSLTVYKHGLHWSSLKGKSKQRDSPQVVGCNKDQQPLLLGDIVGQVLGFLFSVVLLMLMSVDVFIILISLQVI